MHVFAMGIGGVSLGAGSRGTKERDASQTLAVVPGCEARVSYRHIGSSESVFGDALEWRLLTASVEGGRRLARVTAMRREPSTRPNERPLSLLVHPVRSLRLICVKRLAAINDFG